MSLGFTSPEAQSQKLKTAARRSGRLLQRRAKGLGLGFWAQANLDNRMTRIQGVISQVMEMWTVARHVIHDYSALQSYPTDIMAFGVVVVSSRPLQI